MQREQRARGRGDRTTLNASGYSESTVPAFLSDPMIGHIPFVSSSPSSTTGPSLFLDKLVCQNQQEREWLASARVISPWSPTRTKLRQQDGSTVARIAEARNVPVKVISVRDWTLFFNTRRFNERRTGGYRAMSFVSSAWIEFCFLNFSRWILVKKDKSVWFRRESDISFMSELTGIIIISFHFYQDQAQYLVYYLFLVIIN